MIVGRFFLLFAVVLVLFAAGCEALTVSTGEKRNGFEIAL
jgi:hypothetical protein